VTGQPFPDTPVQFVDEDRYIVPSWRYLLMSLWNRTGGTSGTFDIQASLDVIGNTPGDLLMRGAGAWTVLPPSAQFRVLQMGATFPQWGLLGGANFGTQAAAAFLAGPAAGPAATPTFRAITVPDIPEKPTSSARGLTATGANQATALVLTSSWNELTTVAAATGVRLDNSVVGIMTAIFNRGANVLNVYPDVGGQIDALGVNAPLGMAAGGAALFFRFSGSQYYSK
jgi:hypothetical protein